MTAVVSSDEHIASTVAVTRSRTPEWLRRSPWLWAPLAVAALNLLVLAVQLPSVLGHLYLNADIASSPMIASLIEGAPSGRVVTLGNYPWYETLWFMRATGGLPAHRAIWETAPVLFSLIGLTLVVWTSWLALGPWAATITGAILACIPTVLRYIYFAPDVHGAAAVHGALLGAVLVFLVRRPQSTPRLVAIGVALTVLTAAGETDPLLIVAGIVPFALTACVVWLRSRSAGATRLASFALVTSLAAIVLGTLATRAMRHEHIVHAPLLKLDFVNHIFHNVEALIKAMAFLGGGLFFGSPPTAAGALRFVAGAMTLVAVVCVARMGWRWGRAAATAPLPAEPAAAAREVHLTYWGLVGVSVIAGFMLSSQPFDEWSARYLASAFIAVAVLLPGLLGNGRRARTALAIAVAAFGLLAVHDHLSESASSYNSGRLSASDARAIEAVAHRLGLRYGYARFWQAAPLTWDSHMSLRIYPVDPCLKGHMCPSPIHTISTWYAPRPNTPTFFVEPAPNGRNTFPAAGRPIASYRVGRYVIFVYNHDIAAQMGHLALQGCPSGRACYAL